MYYFSNTKAVNHQGFTLIELLVVVLIIGILAAVAVPQYQKAVEKSRAAEAITVLNTLQKGIDMYLLEHGLPQEDSVIFLGENNEHQGGTPKTLDIDLSGLTCDKQDPEGGGYCYSKDFIYYAGCGSRCGIYAFRGTQTEWENDIHVAAVGARLPEKYVLYAENDGNGNWSKSCHGNCPADLVW